MSFSRSVRWTPLVSAIALGLALAACTAGPAQEPATPTTPDASVRATPCGAIAEDIVDAIQRYVDSFATVAAGNLEGASTIGAEQLQTAADRLRRQAEVQQQREEGDADQRKDGREARRRGRKAAESPPTAGQRGKYGGNRNAAGVEAWRHGGAPESKTPFAPAHRAASMT